MALFIKEGTYSLLVKTHHEIKADDVPQSDIRIFFALKQRDSYVFAETYNEDAYSLSGKQSRNLMEEQALQPLEIEGKFAEFEIRYLPDSAEIVQKGAVKFRLKAINNLLTELALAITGRNCDLYM